MICNIRKTLLLAGIFQLSALSVAAQPFLRLPAVIGDHMVLQEKATVKLHGWADPNTTLTVSPSWGEAVTVKVGYDTAWSVELITPAASAEPRSITFATNKKAVRKVDDILIGQVWLCSGQSNMNWSAANGIADMKKELESPMNPQIRLFTVTKNSSPYPQDDCEGRWLVCNSKSALYFSAVGYFFGKRLADELRQPVGLINSSWGGTPVEVWTPANVMDKNPQMVASWKEQPKSRFWQIGSLYNAMIHPLRHTTFAGAIWYQGESNKTNAALYGDEFSMMIEAWRKVFRRTLPFYFVQIAPHARTEEGTAGAVVREQQARVAATVPLTGMAVISDLVDDVTNIHPRYKQGVGDRLAGFALAEVYGKSGRKYKSPTFRQAEFRKSQVYVSFDNAEGGIVCKDGAIRGLEVCDASMKFVPAQGIIDDKSNRLVVWSKQVARPTAVRYCFSDGAIGNLFDTAGLPVAPFRSDTDD
ncbi:sialate O-acetylesterase [Alistipes finegoldii]|uniref:sialate O-acetylesterase n=1 Tax=Alistipes finegoldii TaxID=214856 RepID=UPI0026DD7ABD|nr:sialate O-acetylesterase [Alistipes finegoldii]